MRDNRKKYVSILGKPVAPSAQPMWATASPAEDAAFQEQQAADSTPVAYSLENSDLLRNAPVLIIGYGNAMKNAVKNCKRFGLDQVWVTGTEDKKRAFSCGGYAHVACIGATFDARLFSNAYALLQAVSESGAKSVLVCDPVVTRNRVLCMCLRKMGVEMLEPFDGTMSSVFWRAAAPIELNEWEPSWRKCPNCGLMHDAELFLPLGVCPTCGELYRLNSNERIALTCDEGSFEEWYAVVDETDPLEFPDYDATLDRARTRSGLEEAVRCGRARIEGESVVLCVMETTFMMGSMGSVVGEKVTRCFERATEEGLPVIIFTASGGARMQEGLVSLMQMAKVSAAVQRHSEAGLLYISVITDPTTGGVTASFATLGDIIVSEPRALIGFAGRRVIQGTIKQSLPDDFQTAEFALEHGLIDAVVMRSKMRAFLADAVALHVHGRDRSAALSNADAAVSAELPADQLAGESAPRAKKPTLMETVASKLGFARAGADDPEADRRNIERAQGRRDVADTPGVRTASSKTAGVKPNAAWDNVMIARNVHRPTATYYIDHMVDGFIELHGDRAFADDGAIVGGIGWVNGRAVTVIAEEKGANLEERIKRNFGCPQPEGYRKSLRLMRQAEKFGRPIVCLVDTQGAFCGMDAEERGQGNAIAENLAAMSALKVPVVSIVLGEGGSGGALALAVGNRVAMQEHAVYSVLSPEGFASILWKDRSRAAEAAEVMKMSAFEALDLGIIEEVISEGEGAAHENPEQAAEQVAAFVERSLAEFADWASEDLLEQRYKRFRRF